MFRLKDQNTQMPINTYIWLSTLSGTLLQTDVIQFHVNTVINLFAAVHPHH